MWLILITHFFSAYNPSFFGFVSL